MPSQRQLRVGEELRHALSEIMNRGDSRQEILLDATITVTEVRMSPDLRNATVYVMPLAGQKQTEILDALKRATPHFRRGIAGSVKLRYVPELRIELDRSFDYANKINQLIQTLPPDDRLSDSKTEADES